MIKNNIDALRNERKALRDELATYALRAGDVELQKWIKRERAEFLLSVKTMSDAKAKAIEAAEEEIASPELFGHWLKYTAELEQAALLEEHAHEAYLKLVIAKMKEKKLRLGLK